MQTICNLIDTQFGGFQQEGRFYHEHLVDIIDNSAPSDLTDDTREIDWGDIKFGGVERDVMVF